MKKCLLVSLIFCFSLLGFIHADAQNADVSAAPWQIKIDGQFVNNSEYPFLVHRDILYLPLYYEMCEFMGLETHYGKFGYGATPVYRFYAGNSKKERRKLPDIANEKSTGINQNTAQIAEYDVYILSEKYDSVKEEYPILNFEGITYIPLTWNISARLLDWDCSLDAAVGQYTINTQNATRPQIDYMNYWNTSPNRGSRKRFIYGKNFYVQYPSTAFGGIGDFAYARSGADEIRFNLGDELSKTKITSFGAQKNPENYKSNFLTDSTPLFDGRHLTLICYGGGEHYLISVDMVEGKLIEVSSLQKFLK